MTVSEVAAYLRAHDKYLILTHRRPDGDTLGCAAALCAMLRAMGKHAGVLYNCETTEHFAPYVEEYWVADDFDYETVVSVDLAALSLFPDNAEMFKTRVDLAIDHHPSYEGFGKESCVHPECAACGEILCELAQELGQLTPEVALPLYVAVSTDTGCFVYSNVTANTHRAAAALMETGIDYRTVNKVFFRTKSRKRLALEADMLFATLDPTARKLTLPSGLQIILVDTVGFVSRLPHHLVEAFKSTLEEAAYADVIVKVADAGDDQAAEQLAVTDEVLSSLDCEGIPQLVVYNKCDTANLLSFDPDILLTSAKTGVGLPALLAKIDDVLAHRVRGIEVLLPYDKLALADILRSRGSVAEEEYREDGVYYRATVKIDDLHRFEPYLV